MPTSNVFDQNWWLNYIMTHNFNLKCLGNTFSFNISFVRQHNPPFTISARVSYHSKGMYILLYIVYMYFDLIPGALLQTWINFNPRMD